MAKKVRKAPAREGEQYMMRMPPGLRERVAKRAAANGRSMSAEIVDAIEQSLQRADRVTLLWDLFQKHRENIEAIPHIWSAVEDIEYHFERSTGDSPSGLREWRWDKERAERIAELPPITAEQAAHIRALMKETGVPENLFLRTMKASSVEEIKEYERAVQKLEASRHSLKNPP